MRVVYNLYYVARLEAPLDILTRAKREKYLKHGPKCHFFNDRISDLASYQSFISGAFSGDQKPWFRGHSDFKYKLVPSALRHRTVEARNKALNLLHEFKRLADRMLDLRRPRPEEQFKWVQVAQHYGLGTRLLDWTEKALHALYFACRCPDGDGMVFILNPINLNRIAYPNKARIFDGNRDADIINKYLQLDGKRDYEGLATIAVNPNYDTPRIIAQKGVFTLHGNRCFTLSRNQDPSLIGVAILGKYKLSILRELEQHESIHEMEVFPEPEYVCKYLRRRENLL